MPDLPSDLTSWIVWVAPVTIAIGVSFYYSFGQIIRKQQQDIINVQSIKIETLEKEVMELKEAQKGFKELQAINILEITKLKTENTQLIAILQGRDKETTEYQRQGLDAIKMINDMHTDIKLILQDSQRYAHMAEDVRSATNLILNSSKKDGRSKQRSAKRTADSKS